MNKDIIEISKQLLEATNGGLDIIFDLLPNANLRKSFKIRDEKTASAGIKKLSDGNYVVTDFGGDAVPKNAIKLFAEENGMTWTEALLLLAKQHGISTNSDSSTANQPAFKTYQIHDYPNELDENGFCVQTTDKFSKEDLSVLGPWVDVESCMKCNCYKVVSYAFKKKEKDGSVKVVEISSTDSFPIFAFINKTEDNKTFYKIYQPKSDNKSYKFRYIGGRPSGFINGFSQVEKAYKKLEDDFEKERIRVEQTGEEFDKKAPDKLKEVIICSGERDALNMTSLGYHVVWHNSETALWEAKDIKKLRLWSESIINIPDLDDTGIREGHQLAMQYLDIKTMWLPQWLRFRKDWRGGYRKDLLDFFQVQRHHGKVAMIRLIKKMIKSSLPLQFWDVSYTDKGIKYEYNNVHGYNFLEKNGHYRFEVPGDKNGWIFIKIDGHKVENIRPIRVLEFIDEFLEQRNQPVALRNMMYNTTKLSEPKLSRLRKIDLNFKNYTPKNQTISFSHENWVISKDKISTSNEINNTFVWSDSVLDVKISKEQGKKIDEKQIKILDSFFDLKKDENGDWDIDVLNENCEYFNFLINTSRMHWRDEFINPWIEKDGNWIDAYNKEDNQKYRAENKFKINGKKLSAEQIYEQKQHLINKIYATGYMLHSYKNAAKSWAVYCMENGVIDDDESRGGTGKSLFSLALQQMVNTKYIPSRSSDLFSDKFLYDGVTEHTNIVWFDDADKYFRIGNLYSEITGPLNVNPKFGTPYTIPFHTAPKIIISSNYSLRETDPSTMRRLLFVAFSDYYHVESDELPGHKPDKDFGHQLFNDWDGKQWNLFFNFMAQCLRAYLTINKKFNPPMDGVTERNLIGEIGVTFMDWADVYLHQIRRNIDGHIEFEKQLAIEDLKNKYRSLSQITSNAFTKKLKAYCKLHRWGYMPGVERIQKASQEPPHKTVDWIAIDIGKETKEELELRKENEITDDNMPF